MIPATNCGSPANGQKKETNSEGVFQQNHTLILLKNPYECFDKLSMNGKSPIISTAPPLVLRLSKDERRVFQQNHTLYNLYARAHGSDHAMCEYF